MTIALVAASKNKHELHDAMFDKATTHDNF